MGGRAHHGHFDFLNRAGGEDDDRHAAGAGVLEGLLERFDRGRAGTPGADEDAAGKREHRRPPGCRVGGGLPVPDFSRESTLVPLLGVSGEPEP